MFSESSPPLPWDKENHYSRDAIELYYEVSTVGNELMVVMKASSDLIGQILV